MIIHTEKEYRDALERYLDGALDEAGRERLAASAEASAERGAELAQFRALMAELEVLGDAIVQDAPTVDVSAAVMRAIREFDGEKLSNVIRLDTARGARSPARWRWIAAAAAGIVASAGLFAMLQPDPTTRTARSDSGRGDGASGPSTLDPPRHAAPPVETRDAPSPSGPTLETTQNAETFVETTAPPGPRATAPYRREILTAFRDAFRADDGGARARLLEAAALPLDAAKSIANDPNTSVKARIGAAQAIAGDSSALYTVVSLAPDNRHATYRLAQALSGDPAGESKERAALDSLQGIAPDNALPYYMKARSFLETDPPDIAAAWDALATARSMESASAYALDAALAHREALIASGTDPAVAELLSAFTAARWEYDEYLDLAGGLMETGARYRDAGDTRTAAAIFESVLRMGSQIEIGAALTQERQAAYEIQSGAIQALGPLYESIGNTDDAARMAQLTDSMQESMGNLMTYFSEMDDALSEMLNQPDISSEAIATLAGAILLSGDLNLLDVIGGLF